MTMTIDQALDEFKRLRGLAKNGQPLELMRKDIASLYVAVMHKSLRNCRCKNILQDAMLEIYAKLQQSNKMEINAKARLVAGVVLQWESKHYTNANLNDEVARAFLAKYPQRKNWFAVLPSATSSKEVVAEVAETSAEMPPKEAESESQPTTPKKKKTSAKRK